jgi:hypothetical protein
MVANENFSRGSNRAGKVVMVMKRAPVIALVLIVVVIVGTISFVSLASQSGRIEPSSASASGGNHPVTFYSAISPVGIQLQFELNTTVIPQGGALTAQVTLYNSLSQNLTLTIPSFLPTTKQGSESRSAHAIDTWDGYDYLCGNSPVYDVFGFGLYQGHYAATNLSQAETSLHLTVLSQLGGDCPVSGLLCIGFPSWNPNPLPVKIEFAPKSHLASFPFAFCGVLYMQNWDMQVNATTDGWTTRSINPSYPHSEIGMGPFNCCSGASLNGYWMMPPNSTCLQMFRAALSANNNRNFTTGILSELNCDIHPFSVGSYTLVAEDVWNDTVYAYFQVVPTIQPSASSQVMMTMPVRYVLLIALAVTIAVTAGIVARAKIKRSSPQQTKTEVITAPRGPSD